MMQFKNLKVGQKVLYNGKILTVIAKNKKYVDMSDSKAYTKSLIDKGIFSIIDEEYYPDIEYTTEKEVRENNDIWEMYNK